MTIVFGGDFGIQTTGDLGMRVCSLNRFLPSANGKCVKADRVSPIVTNMLWTESNLERISKAFRKAEKYIGDQSLDVDVTSGNYFASLCVNLDLGMYDDELSTHRTTYKKCRYSVTISTLRKSKSKVPNTLPNGGYEHTA